MMNVSIFVTFRLSMATAFVPDSLHSVVPKILPSGVAAHFGRSAISSASGRLMLDPLFDLTSSGGSSNLPMSEEEFYRMKIKLKDGSVSYLFPHLFYLLLIFFINILYLFYSRKI